MRDVLCSKENLEETFKFNVKKIEEKEEKIVSIQNDIKNGIQRYPRRNEELVFLTKLRNFQLIYELLCAKYSYGMECKELEEIYLKGVDIVKDIGFEEIGYVNFLQFFSIGILLETDDDKMNEMVQAADRKWMTSYLIF